MTVAHVPFAYTLQAVPRGGTVARSVVARDAVPVAIPDIHPDGAPIAASLVSPGGSTRVWRNVGGRAYEEIQGDVEMALVPPGSALLSAASPLPLASEMGLRRVESANLARAMLLAQAHAETCLAMDGRFLVPSRGPAFEVVGRKTGYLDYYPGIRVVSAHSAGPPFMMAGATSLPRLLAWMDENDEFSAHYVAKLREFVSFDGPGGRLRLDVHDPEIFDFDFESHCLVHAARFVFDTGLTNRMACSYPSEFLEGWLAYRSGALDPEDPGEALAAIMRSAGESGIGIKSSDDADMRLKELLSVARWAAGRWEATRAFEPGAGPAP